MNRRLILSALLLMQASVFPVQVTIVYMSPAVMLFTFGIAKLNEYLESLSHPPHLFERIEDAQLSTNEIPAGILCRSQLKPGPEYKATRQLAVLRELLKGLTDRGNQLLKTIDRYTEQGDVTIAKSSALYEEAAQLYDVSLKHTAKYIVQSIVKQEDPGVTDESPSKHLLKTIEDEMEADRIPISLSPNFAAVEDSSSEEATVDIADISPRYLNQLEDDERQDPDLLERIKRIQENHIQQSQFIASIRSRTAQKEEWRYDDDLTDDTSSCGSVEISHWEESSCDESETEDSGSSARIVFPAKL